MKSLLGLIQIGLGIAGLVALVNGQWLTMVGCWVGGLVVGVLGNRAVRATEGLSETGRGALQTVPQVIEALRREERWGARPSNSAVRDSPHGWDKPLLMLALTLQAVTFAGTGAMEKARAALSESRERLGELPYAAAREAGDIEKLHAILAEELSKDSPNGDRIVFRFLEYNVEG